MKIKLIVLACLITGSVFAGNRSLTPEGWITDMDEAMKIAKNENKQILMNFTGSDWCHWCHVLEGEVFEKEAFKAYARKHLVLVELDYPTPEVKQTAEQIAHNKKWLDKLKPQGYPTVYIVDADANAYAETGYREGGPEKYIQHLNKIVSSRTKRNELLANTEAQGLDRARILDELLSMEGMLVANRPTLIDEIIKLSNEDQKLQKKYTDLKDNNDLTEKVFGLTDEYWAETDSKRKTKAKLKSLKKKTEKLKTEYNHLTSGEGILGLLTFEATLMERMLSPSKAIKQIETIINNKKYSSEFSQSFANICDITWIYLRSVGIEAAKKKYDEIIAMAPDTDLAYGMTTRREKVIKTWEENPKNN